MDNDALKNEFLVESFENLSSINEDLTHLEKNPSDKELLNKIYRTVHTMKGSASFLGYKKLQEITHAGENLLDELREGNIAVQSEIIDTLLETFDLCHGFLKNIETSNSEGDVDTSSNLDKLEKLLNAEPEATIEPVENTEVHDEEELDLDSLVAAHREVTPSQKEETSDSNTVEGISSAALESLQELVSDGKVDNSVFEDLTKDDSVPSSVPSIEEQQPASEVSSAAMDSLKELISEGKIDSSAMQELETVEVPEKAPSVSPTKTEEVIAPAGEVAVAQDTSKSIADSFVRVNVNVLDKIMNVVGELVLNRNQILQYASKSDSSEFNRLSQQLNVITSELQSEVMSTRMQPIGNILGKFERLVRDIARSNDKKIILKLSGQETELDKSLIEAIKDPLVHIIRNSCDHGIEDTQARIGAGKSETGYVFIKSYNESGQVTIEISDDGKGLDPERIAAKAIEKGVINQAKLDTMSETQVINLIFKPGFSTAEKVTNISGRGVGMDVVKTNIEKIGGAVSVSSVKGSGTVFKLRIPLTLAIVPSLMIKSEGETFAIPQQNLVELVRLETAEDLQKIEQFSGSEFLRLRGQLTPIFRLGKELSLKDVNERASRLKLVSDHHTDSNREDAKNDSLFREEKLKDQALNIVILSAEDNVYGIVVDEIMDTEEIVVKPLNTQLKEINIFGGATIMGDGKVALILDALGFLSSVSEMDVEKADDLASQNHEELTDSRTEYQENLLFRLYDDRIYAIPLSLVARLEEFKGSQIEKTGRQKIVRYLDAPMPLIGVEKTLGLDGNSVIEQNEIQNHETLNCIVVKIRGRNFGIVVKEIMDISIDNIDIDDTAVDREGIIGTIFINEKTVPLLDLYAVLLAQNLGVFKKEQTSLIPKDQKTILLVDDSPMYRKLEADSLIEVGYKVVTANHGEEGFAILKEQDFDLLITDIEMPHLDGFSFAKKVRDELPQKTIPIIALSTRVSEKDRMKGRDCGFDHHLEKFKKDEVVELVDTILKGNQYGSRSTAS
ncbi:MAG: hypothetical protein CME65_06685 [Halobacteriovoraceae bacterium]|nr:hypothetical protein [Halobacteriovoraceae bacterium]|tara:strand:- start:1183 stop:4227 length:3045 start_codon:yes stop_codon:yes gene_type:complete